MYDGVHGSSFLSDKRTPLRKKPYLSRANDITRIRNRLSCDIVDWSAAVSTTAEFILTRRFTRQLAQSTQCTQTNPRVALIRIGFLSGKRIECETALAQPVEWWDYCCDLMGSMAGKGFSGLSWHLFPAPDSETQSPLADVKRRPNHFQPVCAVFVFPVIATCRAAGRLWL